MADKVLNARFQLRYDTYENWVSKNPILKKGEVAFATLENNKDGIQSAPTVLLKVGDGTTKYTNLKFISAFAADVYDWAKAESKPTYSASEIEGLSDYIGTKIQDTDTQYRIVVDSANTDTNKAVYNLESSAKGTDSWTKVSSFDVPTEAKINALINSAITTLDLSNAYDAKGSAKAVSDALDAYKKSNDSAVEDVKATADDAKKKIDAFLNAEDVGDATIDTLKEIQDYITSDGKAADEMTKKIGALEDKASTWDSAEKNAKDYADSLAKNYATAAQGAKADTALQSITTTANGGLKVTGNNNIDIDDSVVFVFNCGDASTYPTA